MSLPKDFVCKAYHYCWLDCYGCMMIDQASKEELEAAQKDKREYKKKWGFK